MAAGATLLLFLAACSGTRGISDVPAKARLGAAAPQAQQRVAQAVAAVRESLPAGTRIYRSKALFVNLGSRAASFPGEATYERTASGVVVSYNGHAYVYPGSAVVTQQGTGEHYVYPNDRVPDALKSERYDTVGGVMH